MHRACLAVSAKPLVSPTGEAAVDHKVYACAETLLPRSAGTWPARPVRPLWLSGLAAYRLRNLVTCSVTSGRTTRTHGVDVAAPLTSAVCSSRRKLGMVMAVPFAWRE
jgi:hypothetical protein